MTRLNQVLAASQGVAARTDSRWMEILNTLGKEPLLSGITRRYRPKVDGGEQLSPEDKSVQVRTHEQLDHLDALLTRLWDVTATKDAANTEAKADVNLPGRDDPVLRDVPVTTLLFLEKQLGELRDFLRKLPVLDPAYDWSWNDDARAYATPVTTTNRVVQKAVPVVLYPATEQHPAQVQLAQEAEIVGYWDKIDFSGKLPGEKVQEMLDRIELVLAAVKTAREAANMIEVVDRRVAGPLLDYIFA